ncbi:hypothetical protein [Paracoccus sp. Ld10]|uniref:hypothetical protein n=1 Tax=Paracoccus sp. Ld10 TaxID=649158 RepID=UPI00386BF454
MNQHAAPPEFAMSFTQEAVRLECRNGPDWRPLGDARFAGGDMAAVLNGLREQAGGQAGELDTMLVIPDDQILYTVLTVPFGSDTAATIARALEAATPYRADDLAFDWCPAANGDIETLRVAAVARRTLHEAEDFARAQGFRPSGFQARPGDDRFEGHPDFGPSRLVEEQFNRRPFSEPVLSQARVTAPQIEVEQPGAPVVPVISRIIPHFVIAPAAAPAPTVVDVTVDQPTPTTAETPAAVIRHGTGPLTAQRLSPRAEAVHSRAAAARTQRDSAAPAQPAAPQLVDRLRGLDPARLPVLVGGLALMLVMALLFLGRPAPQTELAAAPEAQTPVEAQPPQEAPAPETQPVVAPVAVEPEPVIQEPLTADTAAAMSDEPDALDEALAEALAQARSTIAERAATAPVAIPPAASMIADLARAPAGAPAAAPAPPAETASAAVPLPTAPSPAAPNATPAAVPPTSQSQAAAAQAERLARSARPPRATPAAAAAPAAPDRQPTVPADPLPFAVQNQTTAPVAAARPPSRPAAAVAPRPAPASAPANPPATTTTPAPAAPAQASPAPARPPSPAPTRPAAASAAAPAQPTTRPPSRPDQLSLLDEGSGPDKQVPLTQAERVLITLQLRDLRTAQAGAAPMTHAERGLVFQLADARPTRRPVAVRAPSQQAVEDAVDEARPAARASAAASLAAPRPAAVDPGPTAAPSGAISRSARPNSRPGTRAVANPAASDRAVEAAIASAIGDSPAAPGAVALTALTSSAVPPRRAGRAAVNAMVATAAPVAAALSPSSPDLRAAAQAQSAEAAIADQRRQDAELQAQAEARARSQAAADAQAEAQARAQAEARARAQAQAEAQSAASRNQRYQPPEVDSEPDVVAAVPQNAIGNAAASATVTDGIQLNSTQIIGTIGAGRASRALVRLSNGRVLTLRIGDRINGGTISEIGDSRITYQKQGRAHALGVLNGQ